MTTKTTARVRDGIHHAAAEEAQRNWLQDLVSRCFTCPALKQSAVAYQQIPRHLQGLPPAHKKTGNRHFVVTIPCLWSLAPRA